MLSLETPIPSPAIPTAQIPGPCTLKDWWGAPAASCEKINSRAQLQRELAAVEKEHDMMLQARLAALDKLDFTIFPEDGWVDMDTMYPTMQAMVGANLGGFGSSEQRLRDTERYDALYEIELVRIRNA